MQQMIFIADLIACSTCFGHNYDHHQELEIIKQVVAACGTWCCKDGICKLGRFCVFGVCYVCFLWGMSGVVGAVCGCPR